MNRMLPRVLFGVGLTLGLAGLPLIQAADSTPWLVLGWALTVAGVVCLVLAVAGTIRVQRAIPRLGRLWGVPDHDFRVVSARELTARDETLARTEADLAEARAALQPSSQESQRVTFAEIKTRIDTHMKEGRKLYSELRGDPHPDRIGALYDQIGDWSERAYADLDAYHHAVAWSFRQGGHILSPQFNEIHPTDADKLKIYLKRRGQVLRNVLDGTPGKNLDWP